MKKNPYEDEKYQADMLRALQADVEREAQKHKWESGDLSEEEQMEILEYEKDEGTTIVSDKSKWDQELVRAYKDYEQVHVPNKEELAELVKKAKGDDRSMAEFSRICGEQGPSTFSRIVNGKIEKPVSTDLLVAIAKNAVDPNAVTLDKLLRANGKIPGDELMKEEANDLHADMLAFTINSVKEMLIQYYLKKGNPVMIIPNMASLQDVPKSEYALELPSDFILHVQGIEPKYWNYIFDEDFDLPWMDMEHMVKPMKRYSTLFLRDVWEPKSLKNFKNIFVFTDKGRFDSFVSFLHGVKTRTKITAMRVDLIRNCIVEERKL